MGRSIDCYQILGIEADATTEQIKQAYRREAKRCHPDHGGSHELMLQLIEAVRILSDPALRQVYDQTRGQSVTALALRQWEDVSQRVEAQVEHYARDEQAFESWLDQVAQEVQQRPGGRIASGAVAGMLVGAVLGAFGDWMMELGIGAGMTIGVCVGTLGGAAVSLGGGRSGR